jgi:YbgC/YbaW family acyl-CoA thioester hydrolase
MTELADFTYYHPITVRFADLDPQGHVNNAVYLTYLESARLGYYEKAGIWGREAGIKTGMVVAHIDIDYLAPIFFGQAIQVGVRLARLGQKSFTLAFVIETVPGKPPWPAPPLSWWLTTAPPSKVFPSHRIGVRKSYTLKEEVKHDHIA